MEPTRLLSTNLSDLFQGYADRDTTPALCNQLTEAARFGDADEVAALIAQFEGNPQKYNRATFDILVVNAFWRSCENGNLECAKILQPFSEETSCVHALYAACRNGDKDMVAFLIPFQNWSEKTFEKFALLCAVEGGSLDVVRLILPHVPSKSHRTEALRDACKYNNRAVFDLLYPLSNPKSALNYMEKRKTVTEDEKQMLKDAIAAEEQNKVLIEVVGEAGGNHKRKVKM